MNVWEAISDDPIPYLSKRFMMQKFLDVQDEEIGISERKVFSELEQLMRDAKTVEAYLKGWHSITPGTRKLKASWAVEPMQDCINIHGPDIEDALFTALALEISNEIDAEILNDLRSFRDEIDIHSTSVSDVSDEIALVHYKSRPLEIDSGYFYCPYVPVLSWPWTKEELAFDAARDVITRYGVINYA